MLPNTGDSTFSGAAVRRLKEDIVSGVLPPRSRLRLRELSALYGLGTTPLREALARLAAEGIVVLEGQKGFSVPPVTREHLLDVTRSRQVVEPEALRLAMEEGEASWEDEIVASLALLEREIENWNPADEEWLDRYEERHHRFHRALIEACPLASLRRFCDELYVHKTRYRRVVKSMHGDWPEVLAVHQGLARQVLAREEQALATLRAHIGITAEQLVALIETPPAKQRRRGGSG